MSPHEPESTCQFCDIAAGRSPADRVYETDEVLAFLPLAPATMGHTLVIPKIHISDLWHAEMRTLGPVMEASLKVARALKRAFSPDGLNLINSSGVAATQTIFHLHVHLVPRWSGDRVSDFWPEDHPWADPKRAAVAGEIRKHIGEENL